MLSSLAAREPQLSWYAHSKRDGEKLLEQQPELDWVIVRPPPVYGPGDKEMLPIFQMMARGVATVPGSPAARTSLLHVSDLVAAITACLCSTDAKHQILPLCDGKADGYNWREMADIAAQTWSRKVRLWRVPPWLLNSVAALNSSLARLTGSAPMLTPPKLRELRHSDWVVDNQAITTATGWTPSVSLRDGLEQLKNTAF
jgi:nucleoside-diphosphate-sugar epimerase